MTPIAQRPGDRPDDNKSIEDRWKTLGPPALRFATVSVGAHDAHDVMSNAFLRVERSTGWKDLSNPQSYLFRAVRNEAQDFERSKQRQRRRELNVVTAGTAALRERDLDLVCFRRCRCGNAP